MSLQSSDAKTTASAPQKTQRDTAAGGGASTPTADTGQPILPQRVSPTFAPHVDADGRLRNSLTAIVQRATTTRIQRYPADILTRTAPIDWNAETQSVARSGSGVTGVFFFRAPAAPPTPVPEVVVKPEYVTTGNVQPEASTDADVRTQDVANAKASSSFADALLRNAGITVNEGRMVDNQAEVDAIRMASETKGGPIPLVHRDKGRLKYVRILPKIQAPTIDVANLAKNSGAESRRTHSTDPVTNMIASFNPVLMMRIGHLIAVDAFMNNNDRVSVTKGNIGNLMVNGIEVTAIDSDAEFKKVSVRTPLGDPDFDRLEELFSNREGIIRKFFLAIAVSLTERDQREPSQAETFFDYQNNPALAQPKQHLNTGLVQGVNRIRDLLTAPANREGKRNLKAMANQLTAGGANNVNWGALRAREKYLLARLGGGAAAPLEPAQAANVGRTHAQYSNWKSNALNRVEQIIAVPPGVLEVPPRPPALSKSEKVSRTVNLFDSTGGQAHALKKKVRANQPLSPEEAASLQALAANANAKGSRTAVKVLYEVRQKEFLALLLERTMSIQQLLNEARNANGGKGALYLRKRMAPPFTYRPRIVQFVTRVNQTNNLWGERFAMLEAEKKLNTKKQGALQERNEQDRKMTFDATQKLNQVATDLREV